MSNYVKKRGEVISMDIRSTISKRYHKITSAINREFWNRVSDTENSFYVGSYGRGTAIDSSDIDILVVLPEEEYSRFDVVKGNGQSRLLQVVRQALLTSYPSSEIRADGQIVKINFSDGMKFYQHLKNWIGTEDGMVHIDIQIQIWEVIGVLQIPRLNKMQ